MAEPKNLIAKVSKYVEEYMSHQIYDELTSPSNKPSSSDSSASAQPLDPLIITLSALLHE
jgi:uncharacterized protein